MIYVRLADNGKTVYLTAQGRLAAEDYAKVTPELDKLTEEHDQLNLLFDMAEVQGVDPAAAWRDLKFDVQHLADFQKVAIIGDSGWQEVVTKLGKPFTSAEVRYFKVAEKEAATAWVGE